MQSHVKQSPSVQSHVKLQMTSLSTSRRHMSTGGTAVLILNFITTPPWEVSLALYLAKRFHCPLSKRICRYYRSVCSIHNSHRLNILLTEHCDINYLPDTNLIQKWLYSHNITFLYMFRAKICSSSGGKIVYIQHLVSSLSIHERGGSAVHRLREDILTSWGWAYYCSKHVEEYYVNKEILCIKLVSGK
jgi:hypothetical protein